MYGLTSLNFDPLQPLTVTWFKFSSWQCTPWRNFSDCLQLRLNLNSSSSPEIFCRICFWLMVCGRILPMLFGFRIHQIIFKYNSRLCSYWSDFHRCFKSLKSTMRKYLFWSTLTMDISTFVHFYIHLITTAGGEREPRLFENYVHITISNNLLKFHLIKFVPRAEILISMFSCLGRPFTLLVILHFRQVLRECCKASYLLGSGVWSSEDADILWANHLQESHYSISVKLFKFPFILRSRYVHGVMEPLNDWVRGCSFSCIQYLTKSNFTLKNILISIESSKVS